MRLSFRVGVVGVALSIVLAGLALGAVSVSADNAAVGSSGPLVVAQQSNGCAGLTVAEIRKKTIKTIPCWNSCAGIGGPAPTDAQLQACIDYDNKPKAAPTPQPKATAVVAAKPRADFDYAPVVAKPGESITFVDKSSDPAGGQWQRKWYVDGNAMATGDARWTWKVPDAKAHKIKLVVTSGTTKQSAEVEKTIQQNTKRLCPEALTAFGDPGTTGILMDGADLQKDFERAIERYRQDPAAAQTPPRFGLTYVGLKQQKDAIEWLAAYGGTGSSSFVALPDGQATDARKAIQRENVERSRGNSPESIWPAGSEPALRQAMIDYFEQTNAGVSDPTQRKRLTPGDIFYLALQQRQGEAKEAMLLAHNTLRSLARQGDETYTGIERDLQFVDAYLEPLRQGENGGPYYHLFGTAYFEAQHQANWNPLFWMTDNTLTKPVAEAFFNWKGWELPGTDTSLLSELANTYEQIVRESDIGGNQKPDPEKYCFNVWGGQIAKALYKSGLQPTPPPPPPVPAQYIQDWHKEVTLVDPDALKFLGAKKVDCPVNVTWEGNGYKMTLDQRTGTTYGFYPIVMLPYQEADGSWGAAWIDADPRPYNLTFEAVGKGDLHFTAVEQDEERWAQYVAKVSPGDKYSLSVSPGQVPGTMKAPNGGSLAPTVGDLTVANPSGEDDVDWGPLSGGFLVGGLAVWLVRRARRPRRAPAVAFANSARGGLAKVTPPAPPHPVPVASPATSAPASVEVCAVSLQGEARFCMYCGRALASEARFCHGCGKPVPESPA
ncbi:MAG: hypothetical protein ACYC4L_11105 [Chloroflexota bacterium]